MLIITNNNKSILKFRIINKRIIKIVNFNQKPCSKESEDGPISRTGHSYHFLEFPRHRLHLLFKQSKGNHGEVSLWFFGPFQWRISWKRSHLTKNVLLHHDKWTKVCFSSIPTSTGSFLCIKLKGPTVMPMEVYLFRSILPHQNGIKNWWYVNFYGTYHSSK